MTMPRSRPFPPLPPALPGEALTLVDPAAGRLHGYHQGPAAPGGPGPLLLVHSVNAAASAFEVRPLYEHHVTLRPTYALDLPGFGLSDRSDRAYTPRLMTDAVHAVMAEIRRRHGGAPVDVLGVSLSCEFVARAAVERPDAFRTLSLVSPTGFTGRRKSYGPPGSTYEVPAMRAVLSWSIWSDWAYRQLCRPGVIRYFLERTWGSKAIDEALWAYDVLTVQQPGAKWAPLYFLPGALFSRDINRVYDELTVPVWMSHGVRGDFVDYRGAEAMRSRPGWSFTVFPTGAMPYFEVPGAFAEAHEEFLARVR